MSTLKVAAAQYPITHFESFEDWVQHTTDWVEEAVAMQAEILCFPEYGSMELSSLVENQDNPSTQVVQMQAFHKEFLATYTELAMDNEVVIITPSFPVQVGNNFVNRAYVIDTKGNISYQDKLFMTRFENEEWNISSGEMVLTNFSYRGTTFGIQICYDSEFPLGSHLLAQQGMEILFAPSCTETLRGATRVHIGCRARAMENQCYAIVSQTIGNSEWSPAVDINYGFAAHYATPDKGQPEEGVYGMGEHNEESWEIYELDLTALRQTRKDPSVFNFKDQKLMNLTHIDEIRVQTVTLQ